MNYLFKKKARLIAAFFLFTITAFAQNSGPSQIKVNNGPEYKDPSGTFITSLIGEDASGIYTLRLKTAGKDQFFLEKYDHEMKLLFSNMINFPTPTAKTKYTLQEVLFLKNKFIIFASIYDKETDLNTLYAGTLEQSGNVSPQLFELSKISSKSKRNSGDFEISYSRDSSKICVLKHEKYDKNETEKFGVAVFDENLKSLWSKDIELPYKDKNYVINKAIVDNDGNMHMFSEVYVPRKEREKGDPDSYFEVFSYFYTDNVIKQYEISLGDNVISGIDIRLDDNNNLIGAGFYSEKREYRMKGLFYFTIDPKKRVVKSTSQQEFTKDFLMQFMSEKKAEKGRELANFRIRNILTRDDGGAVVVAEYYLRVVSTYTDSKGNVRYTTRWYYNDLIVANINPNGKAAWMAKIPKKQTAMANGAYYTENVRFTQYMGISSFVVDNKIYIIYNETPKNLAPDANLAKTKAMTNPRKSVTTLVTISADGKLERLPLFPAKDAKSIITPRFHMQLNPRNLLMYGDKGKTYRFVKLQF